MKKNKLLRFLLYLIFGMIIAIFILKKYVLAEIPISEKFGSYQPSSISLYDSIYISTYSTTKYFNLIENGKYELAYKMLSDEYKKYMPFEQYLETLKEKDFSNWVVKSIKQISDITFIVTLEDRDTLEEHIYIVYASKFNSKVFTISPEKFIYYDEPNKVEKSNGLECTLIDYIVFQDNMNFRIKLKNNSSNPVTITDVKIELTLAGRLADQFKAITLASGEEREIQLLYSETSYYIPKNVLIETEKSTIKFELQ